MWQQASDADFSVREGIMKVIFGILSSALFIALIVGAVWFEWWRCGEMFPHAQFACFIGSR